MNKDKKMLFGIGLVFLFLATVSFTYAYFTATIVNKDVKDQVVQTGTLELTYTDGPEIIMNNIKPGATITKEVSVKNTGTLDASYNLVWQELSNEIINDEMVIEATCTRLNSNGVEEGTCENLETTPIGKIRIKEKVSIEPSITHKYNITITFKEINADQNYNQGKSFTGTLGINEYVENTPIYCTFDGDMVQGAEYVNGQYTYRYMQEYGISDQDMSFNTNNKIKASFMNYGVRPMASIHYDWKNITDDGWGVILTDKESTNPVTSKLCSYINNKPVISMAYMFSDSRVTSLDLSNFDTSNVTNMNFMFAGSQATILDLSSFNTSNVTDVGSMFSSSNATSIDLSGFDTSRVTNMRDMFGYSNVTSLDLSNFDTSKVTDMSSMFSSSRVTTLDLSNFDTSNVTDMNWMFSGSRVTALDLSNFDTSKVIDMSNMFYESKATMLDLSNFDTSKVTDMNSMFENMQIETLDLSSFNTGNVYQTSGMFKNCQNLRTIYVGNYFFTSKMTASTEMFSNTTNLVGGNGTKYNSSYTDKTYARIDTSSTPGYFTLKTT